MNLKIHLFAPSVLCVSQSIDPVGEGEIAFSDLVSLLRHDGHPAVTHALAAALREFGLTAGGRGGRTSKTFSGAEIRLASSGDAFAKEVDGHVRELVSLLIRHKAPESLSDELIDGIWQKNRPLNRKSRFECLLVDKQGLLLVAPAAEAHDRVFELDKAHDLAEILLSIDVFLEEASTVRHSYPAYVDFILERVTGWITQPGSQMAQTVSYQKLFELLRDEFQVAAKLDSVHRPKLSEYDRTFLNSFSDGWWEDPAFYEVIENADQARAGLGLDFVEDVQWRQILQRDIRETHRSFDAKNYKATQVLAGSVLEAALLAAILRANPQTSRRVLKGGLRDLLTEAQATSVISPTTDLGGFIDTVASFRNLIHPEREVRMGNEPNEHRAAMSIAAMELVLKELEANAKDSHRPPA